MVHPWGVPVHEISLGLGHASGSAHQVLAATRRRWPTGADYPAASRINGRSARCGDRNHHPAAELVRRIDICSALDGTVRNEGVRRYRELNGAHLRPIAEGHDGDRTTWLEVETATSKIRISLAARLTISSGDAGVAATAEREPAWVGLTLSLHAGPSEPITAEKVVAYFTSRDRAISESLVTAREHVGELGTFDELLAAHERAWQKIWRRSLVTASGSPQALLNLHAFHLHQTASEHTTELDTGLPARGLHGEAYRGHVFWDELFVFPFFIVRFPEIARSLLMYRWRRLPAARAAAAAAGYRGAMYPWQSGSDGRDETPVIHLNPRSGRWVPDHSRHQRHVGIAVAHNIWQYVSATGDRDFLARYGAEMLVEIARFWCSIATYNHALDRYEIRGVIGPDEFHDHYPGTTQPGIANNAYTNVMVARVMRHALEALEMLPNAQRRDIHERLALEYDELIVFKNISQRVFVPFHDDGVISQFEGYEQLSELDWDSYRRTYDDFRRLDRILEAEDEDVNRYRASKQADVLMLLFLLTREELISTLDSLGYAVTDADIDRTVDFYKRRTSHGSTLSAVVHAWVLARQDPVDSWHFFVEALRSDVADVQGGTTSEGIHLGAMAGTVDLLQRCYGGLRIDTAALRIDPQLPPELPALEFDVTYGSDVGIRLCMTHDHMRVSLDRSARAPVAVISHRVEHALAPGHTVDVDLGSEEHA